MACINFHPTHHKHLHSFRYLQNSRCRHRILPCYRFLAFLLIAQALLCIFLEAKRPALLFAFFTIWGAFFALFNFFFLWILNFDCCKKKQSHDCCLKLNQTLYTIALTIAVPIFLIFWIVLLPMLLKTDFFQTHSFFLQIEFHFFVQALLLVDFALSGMQFVRSHIKIIVIVALLYIIVNCTVTLTIFTVYPIMNWKDASTLLWVIVAVVLGVGSFYLFFWLGLKKKSSIQERHAAILTEEEEERPKEKTHQMKQLDL